MRYRDLFDAKQWRKYRGEHRSARVLNLAKGASSYSAEFDVPAHCGSVLTGKQRVHAGYFVQVILPEDEEEVLAEHPHSMRAALRAVAQELRVRGWQLEAIGLDPTWHETGLSGNSGYGYHPRFDSAVHMFEPTLDTDVLVDRS